MRRHIFRACWKNVWGPVAGKLHPVDWGNHTGLRYDAILGSVSESPDYSKVQMDMRDVRFVSGARSGGGYTAVLAAGVRCLSTGFTALGVVTCALLVMTLLVVPRTAHADNGQCQWEGGPGWPTYQSCQLQDCIGAGGYAQCSEPEIRPSIN